ncbi:hypothetical protein CPT_Mater216 [Bacillus phage Mater]|uniref:Uncharacterized protein n=1 Tax=Bacillus phage Mater TaxID=1540090 RepID=A0A0A0RUW1_9CAUD|nr:hypothetical protein CPT_Mater216 [Bacillus phage Mater]AIW03373.1 hypothetical protein CPT_Mater216 [Bacillus phage Mater]
MLIMHDVWANFVDGYSEGHGVPEFHEWYKTDDVTLLDQVPLLLITEELYDYIENDYNDLPPEMLKHIHNRTAKRKNHELEKIEYAAIVTDGKRLILFETDGESFPVYKSRLIPRQFQLALEMIDVAEVQDFGFTPPETATEDSSLGGRILTLKNVHMIGLTRREREMKEVLMDCIYQLSCSKNKREVTYWFTELKPEMQTKPSTVKRYSIDKMVEMMHKELAFGWDEFHEEIGAKLAKYYKCYELWAKLADQKFKGVPAE